MGHSIYNLFIYYVLLVYICVPTLICLAINVIDGLLLEGGGNWSLRGNDLQKPVGDTLGQRLQRQPQEVSVQSYYVTSPRITTEQRLFIGINDIAHLAGGKHHLHLMHLVNDYKQQNQQHIIGTIVDVIITLISVSSVPGRRFIPRVFSN